MEPKKRIIAVSHKTKKRNFKARSIIPMKFYGRKIIRSGGKPLNQAVKVDVSKRGLISGKVLVSEGVKRVGKLKFTEGVAGNNRTYFFVSGVEVQEGYMRQGIANRMVEEIIEIARNKKAKNVLLEVEKMNTGAIALFRKNGFREYGVDSRHVNEKQAIVTLLRLDL